MDDVTDLLCVAPAFLLGGEPIEYRGATLLAFDADGSIERFRGYYDTRQLVLSGR